MTMRRHARRSKPLDEDLLDELSALIGELPEPIAAMATGVEVAREEEDATGIRKRLFELAMAVVRYGWSVAMALLAAALDGKAAPKPLARTLSRAARLTDGQWCALLRTCVSQLELLVPEAAPLFAFVRGVPLAELIEARNHFVHEGGSGDDAPERTLAVLQDAEVLLSLPLRVVTTTEPPAYQQRHGLPLRAGVWRRKRKPVPEGVAEGVPLLVWADRWHALAPWLPMIERAILLPEAPRATGTGWRWVDGDSGEQCAYDALDKAVRQLLGEDASAPVWPSERPALVGRDTALSKMRRTASLARDGEMALLMLTGPQGVGRSRMLESLREAAGGFGFSRVLRASCQEQRRAILRPLRRAVAEHDDLRPLAGTIERAASGGSTQGAAGLDIAIEAVAEALIDSARSAALLLLIDDAQWADDATLKLLSMLAEDAMHQVAAPLLIAVSYCDGPAAGASWTRLLGQIERDVGLHTCRIELAPLSTAQARKLISGVAPLSPALAGAVVEGAAGIPFLLVQAVLAWAEQGRLRWTEGAWHPARSEMLEEAVPGMAELVRARLVNLFEPGSALQQTAAQVLACVGLSGGWLNAEQLSAIMGQLRHPLPTVEHAVETLVAAALLTLHHERHHYSFAQPMVRRAVMADLRRKPWLPRLHRSLLGVMETADAQGEDAAFLADGYAQLGDQERTRHHLGRATEHALDRGLLRQAVGYAERLAELADTPTVRARAGLLAMEAELRAGDGRAASLRHEQLTAGGGLSGHDALRARLLAWRSARVLGEETSPDEAAALIGDADAEGAVLTAVEARLALAQQRGGAAGLTLIEEALDRLGARGGELRYRVLVLRLELLRAAKSLDHPDCRRALDQARHAAEQTGSAWAMLDAENDVAMLESAAGHHGRAVKLLKRVAERAKQQYFGRLRRGALINIAVCHLRAGQLQQGKSAAARAVEVSRKAGDWSYRSVAQSVHANLLHQLDELPAARVAIDEAIAFKQKMADPDLAIALIRRADIRRQTGDTGAHEDAAHALRHARAIDNQDHIARARLWLALDRHDKAHHGELASLVEELSPRQDTLRGPTRKLLTEARQRLPP